MQVIQELVLSGRIVDVMLIFIVLEIAVIATIRYRRGGGVSALPLIANIGAGASLMVALRFSLTGGDWRWITASLLVALAFHAMDISLRWETVTAPSPGRQSKPR